MFLRLTGGLRAARAALSVSVLSVLSLAWTVGETAAQMPGIYAPGDTIVTAFPGVLDPQPPFPSGNPTDETFINLDGPSMQIQRPQPAGPPTGQLIASPTIFTARARDVGNVFAITLDDWPTPNIYLGATSAYGLQIVTPDSDGDGRPERVTTGQPGATFMDGQWGPGGSAGSIWRVDGTTGAVTLFTTIGANAGPGLGDIVYDRSSHQFFVSDLDTGLIYRLDWTGLITDTFDHGISGRPTQGMAPVADDGSFMDVTSPAFDSTNPDTWGYTQPERRVRGMAFRGGRLFYAVATSDAGVPQVWSIGIRLDGTFAGDPRWELDVAGLASTNEVSDIVFDGQGRIILAQRGAQRGSYDYTVFADPLESSVVRYTREIPDDPTTPGTWVPFPDEYAIGFRPDGRNTAGGIALGPGFNQYGQPRSGSCNEYLWTTGEALRDNPAMAAALAAGGPPTVHGLQGNDHELVRPWNDPPFQSYFTDYDGLFGDPQNEGHMGDVEVWQPCQGYGHYIPPYFPPPGWTPPPPSTFNLTLDKEAEPRDCVAGGIGHVCYYTIRITNTGTSWFWGPITVNDWLPANPPGAIMHFAPQPPWVCGMTGPSAYQCGYPPVFLWPGDSVDLYVAVELPVATDACYLTNVAAIDWPVGWGDANPGDDFDYATAKVPNPKCEPPHGDTTNLAIKKTLLPTLGDVCADFGANWLCGWQVTVTNTGLGAYTGNIVVTDTLSVPNAISWGPNPPWTCTNPGPAHTCTLPAGSLPDGGGAQLNPGNSVSFIVGILVPKAQQVEAGQCTVSNQAKITFAPGGSPLNSIPGDDESDSVEMKTPGPNCEPLGGHSDLKIEKEALSCTQDFVPPNNNPTVEVQPVEPLQPAGTLQTVDGAAAAVIPPKPWLCTFAVTITNLGPDNFLGQLSITDTTTPALPVYIAPAPTCVSGGLGNVTCTSAGMVAIANGGSIGLPVYVLVPGNGQVCQVNNHVDLTVPAAGSSQNDDLLGGQNSDDASIHVPSPLCEQQQVIAPEEKVCPIESRKPDGGCCPDGQTWTGRSCSGETPPPPPPPPPTCPPAQLTPTGACCQDGTIWNKQAQACTPPQACPTNTVGTWPNCRCLPGWTGTAPNCKPPPECPVNRQIPGDGCCQQGTIWNGQTCKPPGTECPRDRQIPGDGCCPQGTKWNGQTCKAPETCPKDRQIPGDGCCPQGTTWNGQTCKPPGTECPKDRQIPGDGCCPQGTKWNGETCSQGGGGGQQCPPHSHGTFPACACDRGYQGLPPFAPCVPIQQPEQPTNCEPNGVDVGGGHCRCKPPLTGTWPKCVKPEGPNIQGGGTINPNLQLIPNLQLLFPPPPPPDQQIK